MPGHWVLLAMVAGFALPEPAQRDESPGVREVAPGVRQIDGSKVSAINVDTAALAAALKADKSFAEARKLLGGSGIVSAGPSNTVTHMYKVRDTASGKDMVVILFVKGKTVVDHLIS